ncbi:MAG: hypothetical protein PHN45_08100 [Methylococcales bacterium]|nr:hypothetical protein [Methylococcales bacterium]
MRNISSLLIFCEGAHDVAFVQQVLKLCLGFKKVEWKFSEYPTPFDLLFKTSVQNHAAQNLSLDMTHKFFLPDCVFQQEEHLILVFNTGGSSQTDKVKFLLKEFLPLLANSTIFSYDSTDVVTQAKYLFLYDADCIGTTASFNKIKQDFSSIDDEPTWNFNDLTSLKENPFGAISNDYDKAAYIWGENIQNGTLEDILLPMLENDEKDLIEKSSNFVDSAFTWKIEDTKLKHRIAEIADRKKAIITCAGQRKKSGYSMSVIIGQAKLITEKTFINNPNVKAFSDFMTKFIYHP